MKMTRSALIAVCVLLAASCGQTQQKSTQKNVTYETLEVTLSDRVLTATYSAAISGVQTVEIRPQVSGMITDILIEEGDTCSRELILRPSEHSS